MKIGQIPAIFVLLVISLQVMASDCLQAVEHDIESAEPSYGQIWLEWSARIRNRCEESYYTVVTLNFLDTEGKRIHESLTSTMVKTGDTVNLTKRSLIDKPVYDKIEDTEIMIDPEVLPNKVQ